MNLRFELVDMRRFDTEALLESPHPGGNMLAVLTEGEKASACCCSIGPNGASAPFPFRIRKRMETLDLAGLQRAGLSFLDATRPEDILAH